MCVYECVCVYWVSTTHASLTCALCQFTYAKGAYASMLLTQHLPSGKPNCHFVSPLLYGFFIEVYRSRRIEMQRFLGRVVESCLATAVLLTWYLGGEGDRAGSTRVCVLGRVYRFHLTQYTFCSFFS